MPQIYLPLGKVMKCHVCGGGGKLQLCSRCAERAYCSVECQKQDWKAHRPSCKTDRIDLTSYYPVLACIIETTHMRVNEVHPALRHKVINSPNPDTPPGLLADGSTARIVKLGAPVDESEWRPDVSHWWPTGHTPNVRSKLMRRIAREGNVLPTVMSVCLGLMLGMYSTTTEDGAEEEHRIRLRYRSSPVSDFGIVAGSARVTPEDQLAYVFRDKSVIKGQDPQDHYWIYFTTHKGEEVLLESNMFTFNMCVVVQTFPYFDQALYPGIPVVVPAWFRDRAATRELAHQPQLLMEQRRLSVLRDERILKAFESVDLGDKREIGISDDFSKAVTGFMSRIAGRAITDTEKDLCMTGFGLGTNMIIDTAQTDRWKKFPALPKVGIEGDPGEVSDL
ncbi:hypothetical protein JB92DRAFT_3154498 [Gautieria morchelliformis]|nr:hypothetical protein JB92DRAFT_3154498 [Gautieria morchelliformis]